MSIGSSAGATHQRPAKYSTGNYPFVVGIAPIPQANPEAPKVISQGPSICILDDTDEKVEASWLLVKYLTTNTTYQAEYGLQSGYVPVIKSVMKNKTYADRMEMADGYNNLTALAAKKALEQAESYYASPAFNGSSAAREQVGYLLTTVMAIKDSDGDVDALIRAEFKKAIEKCKAAK
jgi:multiple sugar transport system substrate-binding protein